jgi:hypothetical protein
MVWDACAIVSPFLLQMTGLDRIRATANGVVNEVGVIHSPRAGITRHLADGFLDLGAELHRTALRGGGSLCGACTRIGALVGHGSGQALTDPPTPKMGGAPTEVH